MAKENVGKFYEELAKNKELRDKVLELQEVYDGDVNDWEAIMKDIMIPAAKEAGYDFTAEEVHLYEKELKDKGMSEEELENVSGGCGQGFIIRNGIGIFKDYAGGDIVQAMPIDLELYSIKGVRSGGPCALIGTSNA